MLRLVQNPEVRDVVTLIVINNVISAWAKSSRSDAFNHAKSLVGMLTMDPKFVEIGFQPDAVTYSCLLKCLSVRPQEDAGTIVLKLFDKMESNGEKGPKPTVVCYKTGIKVCLRNNLGDLAEALMDRMADAGKPPNRRTFTDILNYWSNLRTPESAARVEKKPTI